ncbi:MAG: SixA phosphatase family protein [Phototrophicaceae bacterium]
MKLYLMRHGFAEPGGDKPDQARQLTDEGMLRIQRAARVLANMKLQPLELYCSPRVRAFQTAQIVGEALGITPNVTELLDFEFDETHALQLMRATADRDVWCVGHEPTLSQTIQRLSGAEVLMQPGTVARIHIDYVSSGRGVLEWFIAPDVFDALMNA